MRKTGEIQWSPTARIDGVLPLNIPTDCPETTFARIYYQLGKESLHLGVLQRRLDVFGQVFVAEDPPQ